MEVALETHERNWWQNEANGANRPNLWNCNWWQLGKFRNLNPSEIASTFDINYAGVDYPVLRLAEIYLLKAEALIMQGTISQGVKAMNIVRNRACNQGTVKDMFTSQGDASYTYQEGSVMMIPEDISANNALKELMYERLRELAAEDDCGWLDVARFAEILLIYAEATFELQGKKLTQTQIDYSIIAGQHSSSAYIIICIISHD